jgi:hypothetical protein
LAVEFVERGWSMKQIHRLIVTSAAYRQSSRAVPAMIGRDPNNLLLSRGPRSRLPAEAIRDNALAVSGLLSDQMHGPPIYPPQPEGLWHHAGRNAPKYKAATDAHRFRRAVYVVWRRAAPYPSFVNFDAPDRTTCVVFRPRTNTPLQALTLMNDAAYVEAAKALAARILTDQPEATLDDRLKFAFRLCTSRRPTPAELGALKEFYTQTASRFTESAADAKRVIGNWKPPPQLATPGAIRDWATWFYVANVLLNLDETITKG